MRTRKGTIIFVFSIILVAFLPAVISAESEVPIYSEFSSKLLPSRATTVRLESQKFCSFSLF